MEKKYIFFDIDGTLTDNATGEIVPSAYEAVRRLREKGHFVSIATGRANYKAEKFREKYQFDNMVCNGGHGIFFQGKMIENRPLDFDAVLKVYEQAIHSGYGVLVSADDSEKVYTKDFRFYDQAGIRQEPTVYIVDGAFHPKKFGAIYKMYISIPKAEEPKLTIPDSIGRLRFVKEYLMIQPDEKKNGILRMLEHAGGNTEDVVVFGDDYNDLCMFDEQFFCVAMGNACEELKAAADYVTAENTDDGIYKACEKFGWI